MPMVKSMALNGGNQPQPHAAAKVGVALRLQPREGPQRYLAQILGDAGAIVRDADPQMALAEIETNLDAVGETLGVDDKVLDRARDRFGPHLDGRRCAGNRGEGHGRPGAGRDTFDQCHGIGGDKPLHRVTPHEGQKLFDHPLHLRDVSAQCLNFGVFGQKRQPKVQPGQRSAQIVADAGRSIRPRMSKNARPAARTSSAPRARYAMVRPLPKSSAACASLVIGRNWLRKNQKAITVIRTEVKIISTKS